MTDQGGASGVEVYAKRVTVGAESRIVVMATRPTASASSMRQASASIFPVARINQVTIDCALPPQLAMATA